jgi:nitrogen regulatory protein P-II 1
VKEIKAYVRTTMANQVVQALSSEPGLHFSVLEVKGVSPGLPAGSYDFSVVLGEVFERMLQFEVVCRDENWERIVELIRRAAITGRDGDGIIFVTEVHESIRIGTGTRGPKSLPE